MNVLIVNTYDVGGAANACLRLHQGLLQTEINSKVLLKEKYKAYTKSYVFQTPKKPLSIIGRLKIKITRHIFKRKQAPLDAKSNFLKNRSKALEWFSYPDSNYDITKSKLYQEADIINLHWVANFLDYESFFRNNTKPIVWTLHDMNPFTGGEHYLEHILGINENGKPQQRIITKEEQKVFAKNINVKIKALANVNNLTIVAPSIWLANEAKNSSVFKGKDVFCIPYGLDTNEFKNHDVTSARNHFNLPLDKKIILFVAHALDNKRKGFEYLYRAFKKIDQEDIILCAIGENNELLESLDNVVQLGAIHDNKEMSLAYCAADVFVIPSLMDNLPNTVLESLICGTPVIGFPIGGIPDMVIHGENGLLTSEISVDDLHQTLVNFFNLKKPLNKIQIRSNAQEKYNLLLQANRYKTLFENILSQ